MKNVLYHLAIGRTARDAGPRKLGTTASMLADGGDAGWYEGLLAPRLLFAREAVEPETVVDWTVVHERIAELGAERASREREVCRWLLAAERLGIAARSGFGDIYQYANRLLGLSHRQTEERLRVGRMLRSLPQLDTALARGELCFTAVRELTRVATAETDGAWQAFACGASTREIQTAVAERHAGDLPTDRPDPSLRKHRLSFEVDAETMAMFRDLQTAVRAELGGSPTDDQVLLELARRGLGGPSDEGRASYQVAVSRCDTCRLASIDAGGESHAVDQVTADRMECDAQHLPSHTTEVDRPRAGAAARRASQSVGPATRRQVVFRDNHRCVVPGCHNHRYLDVHHIVPRSEGGCHQADNLAVLCGSHHDAVHRGTLVLDRRPSAGGAPSRGLTFRHADGTLYGQPIRPAAVALATRVFDVLRNLGIRATRARQLIDIVQQTTPPTDFAVFVRAALRAQ